VADHTRKGPRRTFILGTGNHSEGGSFLLVVPARLRPCWSQRFNFERCGKVIVETSSEISGVMADLEQQTAERMDWAMSIRVIHALGTRCMLAAAL